ncbi:MAG: DNA adenine methylase [Pirellulales bacterium]
MKRSSKTTTPNSENGAAPSSKLASPLKWHGGKSYLAKKIIELMPKHGHYVEPFFGGGSVMFAKDPEGVSEVANDMNGDLMNFWKVLRLPKLFAAFVRQIEATPFSEAEWKRSMARLNAREEGNQENRVRWARDFFIAVRQSRSGLMQDFAPLSRNRTRRGMNEQVSAWLTAVDGLPSVHQRLKRVLLLDRPALQVIKSEDGPKTLFYLDPPYPKKTRVAKEAYGNFEMTNADHRKLLEVVRSVKGKVMLSSYASPMYDKALSGWNRHDFDQPKHSGSGSTKNRAIESVYCNF